MKALVRYLRSLPAGLWGYWAFLLAMLFAFAVIAEDVIERRDIVYDEVILGALQRLQSPGLDAFAGVLDVIGGSFVILPVTVVVVMLLWRRDRRAAMFIGLAVVGAVGLNGLAKLVFERSRPEAFEALVSAHGYAFPSGHAMSSTAFALAVCLAVRRRRWWWWFAFGLAVAFALAVGASRSYLQVHYPSDVLAGWILATAWVLGVNAWYARGRGRMRHGHPAEETREGAS